MDWSKPATAYSIVRDWNKAQGYSDVSDEVAYIRRDINIRHICIENSSERPFGIALATYKGHPLPEIQFILRGGQTRDVGVNTIEGPLQYIYIYDPLNNKLLGEPAALRSNAQSYVIRDGVNKVWINYFKTAGFNAAH